MQDDTTQLVDEYLNQCQIDIEDPHYKWKIDQDNDESSDENHNIALSTLLNPVEAQDPHRYNNEPLAHIRDIYPNYPWAAKYPEFQACRNTIIHHPAYIRPGDFEGAPINFGEGRDSYAVPYHAWEALAHLFAQLKWYPVASKAVIARTKKGEQIRLTHSLRITWAEMAIAYEANTGERLGTPEHDLAEKARIMHYTFNAYHRKCKMQDGSKAKTVARVFPTAPYVGSIAGICHDVKIPGLTRRPVFDDHTHHYMVKHLLEAHRHHTIQGDPNNPYGRGYRMPPPDRTHQAYHPWQRRAEYEIERIQMQVTQQSRKARKDKHGDRHKLPDNTTNVPS